MNGAALLRSGRRMVLTAVLVLPATSCRAAVETGAPAAAPRRCEERQVAPVSPPEQFAWPLTVQQKADLRLVWETMRRLLGLHGLAPLVLSADRPAAGRRLRVWIFEGEGGPAHRMIDLAESGARREIHAFAWFTAESPAIDERRRRACTTSVCDDKLETCELAVPTCLLDSVPAVLSLGTSARKPTLEEPWVVAEQLDASGYTIGNYDHLFAGASVDAAAFRTLVLHGCPARDAG